MAGRVLLTLFQQSYKGFKGKFFRVCCTAHDPTLLDGFPLYWVRELKFKKPKTLEELAPLDREVCQVLSSLGAMFNTTQLIKHEYDVGALKGYIGTGLLLSYFVMPVSILLYSYILPFFLLLHSDGYCFADLLHFHLGAGMVLNEEKRARLVDALTCRHGALGVAGASTPSAPISAPAAPSPTPSALIVAVPLAAVRASPAPTPLEKDKGVVEIESGDGDTAEGPVFKIRKVVRAATSHSATSSRFASFRDQPPNASSPRGLLALKGAGESAPGNN